MKEICLSNFLIRLKSGRVEEKWLIPERDER